MLRALLANATHTPRCIVIVAEVAKRGFRIRKANFIVLSGGHYCKGRVHKSKATEKRRNEFAVVNKMLDSNIDLFAMATLFRVFTFCFQEQLFKPILATCTNISLIHMKQCRASTHSITENFIKRTIFTSAPSDLQAYMSLKMCVCVVSETRFVSSSRPFQCALSFGERLTCTDCYPFTFNVGV